MVLPLSPHDSKIGCFGVVQVKGIGEEMDPGMDEISLSPNR